jgi:hypothetical protein
MKWRWTVRAAAAATVLLLAGCGGGASFYVFIGSDGTSVPGIDLAVSRAGARSIQLQWTDDSYADTFRVERDGATLVRSTKATSVVDSSFLTNTQYCYQVFGLDFAGRLVSASEEVCIVV